ncbi:MAG: hypothetical protein MUE71_10325, partial [Chitinophagaceae bacterium]|nr:hypothetical protein [Chitinophagaceae bacterium]
MHSIQNILTDLGFAMMHSVWQLAVLLAIYFLVSLFLSSPVAKHKTGLILSAAGTVWFFITFATVPVSFKPFNLQPGGLANWDFPLNNWLHYFSLGSGVVYL